jgi:hypothetical protein
MEEVELKAVDREQGVLGAKTLFIVKLLIVGMKKIEYSKVCQKMRDERQAGSGRQSIFG